MTEKKATKTRRPAAKKDGGRPGPRADKAGGEAAVLAKIAAIRGQLTLPGNLRELPIMAIAVLNKADYEWAQHESEFLKAGGTMAQLAALRKLEADPNLFDEKERAALQLTIEMTREVRPKQATIDKVRSLLPDQQVVELIGTIAGYNMVSRFVLATGVEIEATQ